MKHIALALLLVGCGQAAPSQLTASTEAGDKISETPDFMQTSRSDLPGGGSNYCGPVAVSNALVWLGEHGYDELLPSTTGDRAEMQYQLIAKLGSETYMRTDPDSGTDPDFLLEGLMAYLEDKSFPAAELRIQGWRSHPDRFGTGIDVPEVAWATDKSQGDTGVFLNIGWYAYDSHRDRYTRDGGHWVTLVGFAVDPETGKRSFIIRDPSPRSGRTPRAEVVTWDVIGSGQLTGTDVGLPRSAAGFMELGGDLRHYSNAAILDAVVALSM